MFKKLLLNWELDEPRKLCYAFQHMKLFTRKAKLGSLENPEIIEPGRTLLRPTSGFGARLAIVFQTLKIMTAILLPAVLLDWICVNLAQTASHPDGVWAGVALFFLVFPAVLFTLIAAGAVCVFVLVLVLMSLGKSMVFTNDPRFRRFTGPK